MLGCTKQRKTKKDITTVTFKSKERLLLHYIAEHQETETQKTINYSVMMLEARSMGLFRFSYVYGIIDKDSFRKLTEQKKTVLINLKLLLWEKLTKFTGRAWKELSVLMHGPATEFNIKDLQEFIPKYDRWMYNTMSYLASTVLKSNQNMLPKFLPMTTAETFDNQLKAIQTNIPFEIAKSNNFMKLLQDCHTIGIDLFEVHKVIHELANTQTQHMLEIIRGVPPLHLQIWDSLTTDKILQPILEMFRNLETQQKVIQEQLQTQHKDIQEQGKKLDSILEVIRGRECL